MVSSIEDYALLSNQKSAGLISKTGSVDWLAFPRFDSPAVFAALLGSGDNGAWLLAPASFPGRALPRVTERYYEDSTFVLHTHWQTDTGTVIATDFMPIDEGSSSLIRRVRCVSGVVEIFHDLKIRFGYGKIVPWVTNIKNVLKKSHYLQVNRRSFTDGLLAFAGPDGLVLYGTHIPEARGRSHAGSFRLCEGEEASFELSWFASHKKVPEQKDLKQALTSTAAYWASWASRIRNEDRYSFYVRRSLLVLKALTHRQTFGIVAAPTMSLPESLGGKRNWDYRFCWLRDAALTLKSMLLYGFKDEAVQWRNWLLRAIAGDPEDLQIMYGISGERDLEEHRIGWLPGYGNSFPVREGNRAAKQYQAETIGEVMEALEVLRDLEPDLEDTMFSWPLQRALLVFQENHISQKDQGIWEVRGRAQYFTQSRVMMWSAFSAGIRGVKKFGFEGPVERWMCLRDRLYREIMDKGFNEELNSFTQFYGSMTVDASLLQLPHVGFIAYDDPKMLGTVAAIEKELLTKEGLLLRYRTESGTDGVGGEENSFLACSFWLVEQYACSGRMDDAIRLMDQLTGYLNDVGLLAEEYDAVNGRQVGNFPQAFSHLTLIRAADAIRNNTP